MNQAMLLNHVIMPGISDKGFIKLTPIPTQSHPKPWDGPNAACVSVHKGVCAVRAVKPGSKSTRDHLGSGARGIGLYSMAAVSALRAFVLMCFPAAPS